MSLDKEKVGSRLMIIGVLLIPLGFASCIAALPNSETLGNVGWLVFILGLVTALFGVIIRSKAPRAGYSESSKDKNGSSTGEVLDDKKS